MTLSAVKSAKFALPFVFPALILVAAVALSGRSSDPKVWGVMVSGLPDRVTTALADEDVPLYILKQTHEPLLRSDDGQNYYSKVLTSWRRNADSSEYLFCPDPKSEFDAKYPLTPGILREHLEKITARFSGIYSVGADGECVGVKFGTGRKGYMQFLSMYENAPTLKLTDLVELGLGKYRVSEINREHIRLEKKRSCRNCYGEIMVYESARDYLSDLQRPDIADFNRIAWREIPEEVLSRFKVFDNIPLKSFGLVLVSSDKDVRRTVYNCMDIAQLRRAVYPHAKRFNDISTILPAGVPGARPGRPAQECGADKSTAGGKRIVLAAVDRDNRAQLQSVAADFFERTGIKMDVHLYSAGDLVQVLFDRPHPYDMVPIVYSVVQPEYETFFKDFCVKDGFLDYDLPRTAELRSRLLRVEDERQKSEIAVEITKTLAEEYVILPLFQEVKEFYYPTEIRNLVIGKGFTEYPEVADFRW